jgi:hypothetical protein
MAKPSNRPFIPFQWQDFILSCNVKVVKMKYFAIAAASQILVAISHVIGHFTIPRNTNPTERKLVAMMATYEKEVAGGKMSILHAYDGLNVSYALFFLLIGAVNLYLWRTQAIVVRQVSLINAIAMGVGVIVSLFYFFWIPVVYFSLTCLLFLIATTDKASAHKRDLPHADG